MKIVLTALPLVFFALTVKGQIDQRQSSASKKLDSTKYKYDIKIDFVTGKVDFPKKQNSLKPKSVKVGSVLQLSVINLPQGYNVKAKTYFENDKMEGASVFNGFITKGMIKDETPVKKAETSDTTKAINIEIKNAREEATKEQEKIEAQENLKKESAKKDKIIIDQNNKDKKNQIDAINENQAEKNYKTDIDNLKQAFDLGNVRNFLNGLMETKRIDSLETIGNKSSLKLALIDLVDQQTRVINNAQDNINDRKKINKEQRELYAQQIDSLKVVLAKINLPTKTVNVMGVQILNRDYTNMEIEIKDGNNNLVDFIPLVFANQGGFKLDFSTGIFNTFRKTFDYEIKNDTSKVGNTINLVDTAFVVNKLNKGKNNLSIGILAHGYVRASQFLSPGLTFGFSYGLETKSLNILSGVSLLLGKEQRLILSGGCAFSNVTELTLYNAGSVYNKTILNQSTDLKLTKIMKASPFVGITYNLGTIKGK